jgi:hypothetical protein
MTDPQDDASRPTAHRRPSRRALALAGSGFAVALLILAFVVAHGSDGGRDVAAAGTTSRTSSSTPTSAAPATAVRTTPAAVPGPSAPADPAAEADLARVAASLPHLVLSSPTEWDRWAPDGRPYPNADVDGVDVDMASCPHLAARLGGALGTEMSYWTGTLPMGPNGCTWVPVPLSYDGPYDYAYLVAVGFLADGSTTDRVSGSFYHHEGRLCPRIAAPAAGDGAFLARCEEPEGVTYELVLPDARTPGVWVLGASARDDAQHPAADVLAAVLDGVGSAYR